MGLALFSQRYSSPAIHEQDAHAPNNPAIEKISDSETYPRWSTSNPFDPDSEDFFATAQEEMFIYAENAAQSATGAVGEAEEHELTEQQVLISSSIPPSNTDPNLLPPNAGAPLTDWAEAGPNMWVRTVRRRSPTTMIMADSDSSSPSESSTPRSASPQTPDDLTRSPGLPGLVVPPAEEFIPTRNTPSRHRRVHGDMVIPSPPSPRLYTWTRTASTDEDGGHDHSPASRRRTYVVPRRANPATRSRTTSHHPIYQLPPENTSSSTPNRDSAATTYLSRRRSTDDSTIALLRRLVEQNDRTREFVRDRVGDLDAYFEWRLRREETRTNSDTFTDRAAERMRQRERELDALSAETMRFVAL